MTLVLAADLNSAWGFLWNLDARISAFCEAHNWHFPEHQKELTPMQTPTHVPFTRVAAECDVDLIEAVLMAKARGALISYGGMIGEIQDHVDDMFIFSCPEAKFEDFVPASSLCAVS